MLWRLNRLRAMSALEIVYRFFRSAMAQWERYGVGVVRPGESNGQFGRSWLTELSCVFKVDGYHTAAERVLAGRCNVFGLRGVALGFPPNWNRDPKTGTLAPLVFGKTLNYRDPSLVGDIKYLWEPNRHLQLTHLAQAWSLTRDQRYLDGLREQLSSWLDQCPYPKGPNWTSSLELAIRLINWSFVWQLTGGADGPLLAGPAGRALRDRWLTSIYQHAHFIQGHYSRYSSANNHLIGEAAGVAVAASTWPVWDEMGAWGKRARSVLREEALRQNAPDGVNREQAISYLQFVWDFLFIAARASEAAGKPFDAAFWTRLESMLDFLAAIMDAGGHVPMIGDADDGYVVTLDPSPEFCPYRSLLATGAILFKRADFKRKARRLDDKTRWLLGEDAQSAFDSVPMIEPAPPSRCDFPEGGYLVLGKDFETDREVRSVIDCGPLGYLSIAAHGHADALAFTFSLGGREFLVDPGTYAYHTKPVWRNYFRSTAAHNTVRVDGLDQSVIGGNFMWLRKAKASRVEWVPGETLDRFVGMHDGYRRLKDPVTHSREFQFDKVTDQLIVTDRLECRGAHEIERFFHFAEDCVVEECDGGVIAQMDGHALTISVSDGSLCLYRGDESKPLGWISRRFDVKVPTMSVVWRTQIQGERRLVTCLRWEF
nr:alginate lyase family protein [Rhabdochromatium marinum]